MALYEVPDEISLLVVNAQFQAKFLTKSFAGRKLDMPSVFVCVPQMYRPIAGYLLASIDDSSWVMMDRPDDITPYLPRDRAEQRCIVCQRTASEVNEHGCGYDPKKHG